MNTNTNTPAPAGQTLGEIAKNIMTQPEPDPRTNGELLKLHGLKLVHIRPNNDFSGRGMSIAYRDVNKNVIEIATAIVHPNDEFAKKAGGRVAIENFVAGRTVYIRRIFRRESSAKTIQATFGM